MSRCGECPRWVKENCTEDLTNSECIDKLQGSLWEYSNEFGQRAEPKQGEWLFKKITDDYHITGQCSVCKERRRIDNFCPNCGARMKGASR